MRDGAHKSCLAENNFRARFICVSYFSCVHFYFVVSFILMPEIKETTRFCAQADFPVPANSDETHRGKERKKTAQQDSYHLSPRCDSLISVGLSSPLRGPPPSASLHHPILLFGLKLRVLSASALSRVSRWKLEESTNQRGAKRKEER